MQEWGNKWPEMPHLCPNGECAYVLGVLLVLSGIFTKRRGSGRTLLRMAKQQVGVILVVNCACGVVMRGTENVLVPIVQKHAREAHNMNATREEVLAKARPES